MGYWVLFLYSGNDWGSGSGFFEELAPQLSATLWHILPGGGHLAKLGSPDSVLLGNPLLLDTICRERHRV